MIGARVHMEIARCNEIIRRWACAWDLKGRLLGLFVSSGYQ